MDHLTIGILAVLAAAVWAGLRADSLRTAIACFATGTVLCLAQDQFVPSGPSAYPLPPRAMAAFAACPVLAGLACALVASPPPTDV